MADGRETLKQVLAHWLADPDLAGISEPDALNRMSDGERAQCVALWKAVDAVLQRVQ
jgi:hypothetical protein